MGGMTAAVVASRATGIVRGVILVDPTFLSPQRQREVCDSDVAERHRRLLSQDECEVLVQLRSRHARRSPEILELIASARLQTRMSAFEVLTPPNPEYDRLVSRIDVPILLVIADMPGSFPSRRNDSAAVLRGVEAGRTVVVTRNGTPVAELRHIQPHRFVPRAAIADAQGGAPRIDARRFREDLDAVIDQRVDG